MTMVPSMKKVATFHQQIANNSNFSFFPPHVYKWQWKVLQLASPPFDFTADHLPAVASCHITLRQHLNDNFTHLQCHPTLKLSMLLTSTKYFIATPCLPLKEIPFSSAAIDTSVLLKQSFANPKNWQQTHVPYLLVCLHFADINLL